ncbi:MAG: BMC domain-containing protein [Clostridium sp.]
MIIKALGMVEVDGYLAGVTAADAALKAASVTLIALEKVNAGITNVQVTGDIGAVKAAVDAGSLVAEELGMLRASHVIARLHEETLKLFPSLHKKTEEANRKNNVKSEAIKVNEEIESLEKESKTIIEVSKKLENEAKDIIKEANIIEEETEKIIEENIKIKKNIKDVINENKDNNEIPKTEDLKDYNSMKVDDLRRMVRSLNLPHLTNKQIKFERKDVLIKILQDYGSEGEK